MNELWQFLSEIPLWLWFCWVAFATGMSFLMMSWDKLCAVRKWRRIPEVTLLFWAFVGGAIGAKTGQHFFRHKTRKEPFRTWLNIALVFNVGVGLYLSLSRV